MAKEQIVLGYGTCDLCVKKQVWMDDGWMDELMCFWK